MKIPSSDLYDLIKSMSPYERRKYSLIHKNHNNKHFRLFLIVSGSKQFNESNYIQLLGMDDQKGNYQRIKNYLYNDILEFLSMEAVELDETRQSLEKAVSAIRILIRRALISQAEKQLQKAKKRADQYNLIDIRIALLDLEYHIIRCKTGLSEIKKSITNFKSEMNRLQKGWEENMFVLVSEMDVYHEIIGIQTIDYRTVRIGRKERLSPLLAQFERKEGLLSDINAINAGYVLGLQAHFNKDYFETIRILQRCVDRFNQNPSLKKHFSYKYLLTLNNLGDNALLVKDYKTSEHVISVLNQEQKLLKGMESTVNDIYLNIAARQLWIRKTGFDSTAEQTNKMAHEIMLKNTWMIPRIGFETIFQLIQLSVITEQYRICIALINHFLRNNKENLETESLCSVHLLELIIHTENGAFLLVNSLARSFSQHKVREKKILNTIAVFFREIAKNERIPDRTKFEAMNDQITAYKREIPVFLRQSLFTNWVDSKIQKKTLWQMHQDTLEET